MHKSVLFRNVPFGHCTFRCRRFWYVDNATAKLPPPSPSAYIFTTSFCHPPKKGFLYIWLTATLSPLYFNSEKFSIAGGASIVNNNHIFNAWHTILCAVVIYSLFLIHLIVALGGCVYTPIIMRHIKYMRTQTQLAQTHTHFLRHTIIIIIIMMTSFQNYCCCANKFLPQYTQAAATHCRPAILSI